MSSERVVDPDWESKYLCMVERAKKIIGKLYYDYADLKRFGPANRRIRHAAFDEDTTLIEELQWSGHAVGRLIRLIRKKITLSAGRRAPRGVHGPSKKIDVFRNTRPELADGVDRGERKALARKLAEYHSRGCDMRFPVLHEFEKLVRLQSDLIRVYFKLSYLVLEKITAYPDPPGVPIHRKKWKGTKAAFAEYVDEQLDEFKRDPKLYKKNNKMSFWNKLDATRKLFEKYDFDSNEITKGWTLEQCYELVKKKS